MITREITSLQHPIVKHLVKVRTDRHYRREQNRALVTGKKLIQEMSDGFSFITLIITADYSLPQHLKANQLFIVTSDILKKITGLDSPEPIAAEVELPIQSNLNGKRHLLALDGVSDPGNLGTLLRTALALGWEGVFITKTCTDPFNEKALRAAKGATFRLPIFEGTWEELLTLINDNRLNCYVADARGQPIEDLKMKAPILLVLGNESHGASPSAKSHCKSVAIPMESDMESLNVATAGAILMFAMRSDR